MGKLLAEGFRRLFKGRRFYVCLIILIFFVITDIAIYKIVNSSYEAAELYADQLIFSGMTLTVLMTAITGGMLISKDYANNTIRNKIIVGHSRTNIYIANWIVTAAIIMIYHLAFILMVLAVGIPLLGAGSFPSVELFEIFLLTLPLMLAFSSLYVFITMSMKSVGGAIIAIAMHYVFSLLSVMLLVLRSKHEKYYEFLNEFLPSLQIDIISQSFGEVPEHAAMMALYSVIIAAASTVGGILIFNKTDIK